MKRRFDKLRLACVALGVFASASPQAQTADQLRQLEQLTPAQRAALLEALGESSDTAEPELTDPVLVVPRTDSQNKEMIDGSAAMAVGEVPAQTEDPTYPSRADLKPFGYDLFAGQPTTFAPATDIPVPVDYVVGPGDTIELQLFGSQNALYSLVVARDGVLNVPEIGPVSVSGLTFSEMTRNLQQRVAEQMIGVKASITMGPLRSIRVFVLGDAYKPGSYTVSALSTMTNALFVSGGIEAIGSLRNIQLKRNGRVVTTLDLYDLLLRGDTSADARLQPGDVLFVPPIGTTVGVGGAVRRPAIYELRGESTVSQVLQLAGGMLPSAYPRASQISRISDERERTIIDIDLSTPAGLATKVTADDLVSVFSVLDRREAVVLLQGHVHRPGPHQWRQGMRVTDLLPSIQHLRPKADLDYVLVRREDPGNHQVSVLSADLTAAYAGKGGDVTLRPLDEVVVFDREGSRDAYLAPIIEELRLQARLGQPPPEARIAGRVRAPGVYPIEEGMRISDLVRAGGHLLESAYDLDAELTRYEVAPGQQRETRLVTVDLDAALSGDAGADLMLQPYDILNVKEIPLWRETEIMSIEGEVRFPGNFPIRRGERLSSVMERAGGLTDLAFPQGAIFLRESLREREREQIEGLAERLQSEIDSAAASESDDALDVESKRALLEQVKATRATGRLVINLDSILNGSVDLIADISLQDGDRLLVPRETQTVTIIGEVQFPTSHVFEKGISRDDYINLSGGMTALADKKRVYVVRADGSVIATRSSAFFRSRDMNDIRPGDTIVVPIKADPISTLALWTSLTTIVYNIGVAAAAVSSF